MEPLYANILSIHLALARLTPLHTTTLRNTGAINTTLLYFVDCALYSVFVFSCIEVLLLLHGNLCLIFDRRRRPYYTVTATRCLIQRSDLSNAIVYAVWLLLDYSQFKAPFNHSYTKPIVSILKNTTIDTIPSYD